MSIFLPYTPYVVISYLENYFSISLSTLTPYENLHITILANLYFFIYWFIIIYFGLLIFNRIWERLF